VTFRGNPLESARRVARLARGLARTIRLATHHRSVSAETAAVVSAFASAVAALAAWAAVAQAVRWQRRQREPWLTIDVSEMLGSGLIRVRIENTGGGVAQAAVFWVREGSEVCSSGIPPSGSLSPGGHIDFRPDLTPSESRLAEAVVICRFGRWIHAWDAAGRHKKWLLNAAWRKLRKSSNEVIVHRFYPHAPLIDQLRLVGFTIEGGTGPS
jgi:hypothetical protein